MSKVYCCAIETHYREHWGDPVERHRWAKGPVSELSVDFEVLQFRCRERFVALATRCMSESGDPAALEVFVLVALKENEILRVVELLVAVAHFHRTGKRLGLAHTVSFGRPWLHGSQCRHGLLSRPYLEGPEFEFLRRPSVRFLWLLPITPQELGFKKRNGVDALEARFETAGLNYLAADRDSVVADDEGR